jgi:hypothetical protein
MRSIILWRGVKKSESVTSIASQRLALPRQRTYKKTLPRQQRMKTRSRYNEETELLKSTAAL